MEIKILPLGHIKTNCYLISTDKAALVIDPGFKSKIAADFLEENKDKDCKILLTHSHFDHIGGAEELRAIFGAKIGIGKDDACGLEDSAVNLSDRFHAKVAPFTADELYNDGDIIEVGDLKIKVIFTPGHTPGGVSYLINDALFAGDTLFRGSVGRTDFPNGNFKELMDSLQKLFMLPDDIKVYSGHGEWTTIGYEKKYNMFAQ